MDLEQNTKSMGERFP